MVALVSDAIRALEVTEVGTSPSLNALAHSGDLTRDDLLSLARTHQEQSGDRLAERLLDVLETDTTPEVSVSFTPTSRVEQGSETLAETAENNSDSVQQTAGRLGYDGRVASIAAQLADVYSTPKDTVLNVRHAPPAEELKDATAEAEAEPLAEELEEAEELKERDKIQEPLAQDLSEAEENPLATEISEADQLQSELEPVLLSFKDALAERMELEAQRSPEGILAETLALSIEHVIENAPRQAELDEAATLKAQAERKESEARQKETRAHELLIRLRQAREAKGLAA